MVKIKYHKDCRIHKVHYGSGMPIFRGELHQRGYGLGGLISGLIRSTAVPLLKSTAKKVGKMALKTGSNILSDVLDNKSFADSIKTRMGETLQELPRTLLQRNPQRFPSQHIPQKKPRTSSRKRTKPSKRHQTKRRRQIIASDILD